MAARLFVCVNDVENAVSHARAEVVSIYSAVLYFAYRGYVTLCEVNHVDIIAHARAVGSIVIVAEHAHLFEFTYRNLCNVGREVVGYAAGVLADESAGMRAHGVEVAQEHHRPLVVGLIHVV